MIHFTRRLGISTIRSCFPPALLPLELFMQSFILIKGILHSILVKIRGSVFPFGIMQRTPATGGVQKRVIRGCRADNGVVGARGMQSAADIVQTGRGSMVIA